MDSQGQRFWHAREKNHSADGRWPGAMPTLKVGMLQARRNLTDSEG